MALGDGIRRNIAHVEPSERAMLRDAILELNRRFFPGSKSESPPGGVSWWFKQDEIHQATHVHHGPEFLPWHRVIVNRFEELIRQINPQLSLHYWDWTQDPTSIPNANMGGGLTGTLNLFTDDFMGHGLATPGPIGPPWQNKVAPWRSDGFYVPGANPDRDGSFNPADPPKTVTRSIVGAPANPTRETNAQGTGILDQTDYAVMRDQSHMEGVHDDMHNYVRMGGTHVSFRDPFVFLLHSNVDRLFARWQTDPAHPERLEPTTVYGSESAHPALNGNVEPWSSGHSVDSFAREHLTRPWYAPESEGVVIKYKDLSVVAPPCYDTNLSTFRIDEVENPLNTATGRYQVVFNDVPEEETTWRAAVIRLHTCPDTTFRVKPGTEPAAPFGIAVGQATAVHGAHEHLFLDVRIWFQYTAGGLGTAPQSDGPVATTIICDQTNQVFEFELIANTLHRKTVAVQMVLDQSGSMAWLAGTSGVTRLNVLKDAANLFATVIQNNNGLGIVRFDQNAYAPNDPTYGGMPITRIASDADRNTAHAAINLQGAHGETSVGDGLVMGHSQIIGLPIGGYDEYALLLLTDGIENQPVSIADAIQMGAVDSKVFAVGLGNEFQVNTAALNSVSGTTGGKLLLSGVLTPDTDDYFRVKKFFLQILATVSNTSIVRDPTGHINVGTRIRIPFQLSEADINCRVILLTDYPVVKLSIETPDGQTIDDTNAAAFGVTFKTSGNTRTSSFNLPVAFQAQKVEAGTWYCILEVDPALYKRALNARSETHANVAAALGTRGAKYCVSVHSFSNLRMTAAAAQNSYEPGATLTLRATLTEYNLPVDKRATVRATLEYPDHTNGVLSLAEVQPGVFEGKMVADMPGIYRFTVQASGATYKGVPFTREELLTAAVFHEVENPSGQPAFDGSKRDWCRLLECLLSDKNLSRGLQERLKKEGINLDGIRRCLKVFCEGGRGG